MCDNSNEMVNSIEPKKHGLRKGFLPEAGQGVIIAPGFGSTPLSSITKFPQAKITHAIIKYIKYLSNFTLDFFKVFTATIKAAKNAKAPQKHGVVTGFGKIQSLILKIVPSF